MTKRMLRLASVPFLVLWADVPAARAQDRIDVHVHLISLAGQPGGSRAVGDEVYARSAKRLVEDMDANGVDRAIVLPPPGSKEGPATEGTYLRLREAVRAHPGRLHFLAGGERLNPMIQTTDPERVTREIRAEFEKRAEEIVRAGARGFGEMAALHLSLTEGHPFEEVSPDHPLFFLLADIAARHDLPIDLHMDAVAEDMDFPARLERLRRLNPERLKANVTAFEKLLDHEPKARIVWQHAGTDPLGGMTTPLLARLLGAHPNLYVALRVPMDRAPAGRHPQSTLPLDAEGRVKAEWLALFSDFPDRFVIGTDNFVSEPSGEPARLDHFPTHLQPRPFATWSMVDQLPAEVAKKVGAGNAMRIYGLE